MIMKKETLFSKKSNNLPPLANRMRPNSIDNFVGQRDIVGKKSNNQQKC